MKKNLSISLIRIMAMTMILCDHIILRLPIPMRTILLQITNSGVPIFLFISGYLYGNKQIGCWSVWFKNRAVKILIPAWIFMIIDFIIEFCVWGIFDIRDVWIFLFNVQGIFQVHAFGGGHLWFLTLIIICYLITPLLQWIRCKNHRKFLGVGTLAGAIIIQAILAYTTDTGMVVGHTLSWCMIAIGVYIVGYFAGNWLLPERISIVRIGVATILAATAAMIVLFFNRNYDGQIIYDRIIIYYGLLVVDWWLCTVLYRIGKQIQNRNLIRLINHFDNLSYEVYIVQALIMNLLDVTMSIPIYIVATFVLSYIAARILHFISSQVQRFFMKINPKGTTQPG